MRDIQQVIAALGSPVRRDILAMVWDRELPAGEIAAAFDVTKPTISQHLAVLRDAGLVTLTVEGTSRRYRAQPELLRGLRAALSGSTKWTNADDVPERTLADAYTTPLVVASVDVEPDQDATFTALTDGEGTDAGSACPSPSPTAHSPAPWSGGRTYAAATRS